VARSLTWLGAEVILQPTLTTTPDRALELVVSQANAIFNQCYFVGLNAVSVYGGGYSLIVDPDGRVIQQTGANETILIETLDLDQVTRAREYGNLGMAQTLKQLRDSNQKFPIYSEGVAQGAGFKKLGPLGLPRRLAI
jgi:formamidase